ncbi:hypothetical protein X011_12540 [Mycobacterium tuberculosis variant microti OV254]|nr:hypothetical protein X011_12540 [Mycobacterium tuberculosis variant microti OV254]
MLVTSAERVYVHSTPAGWDDLIDTCQTVAAPGRVVLVMAQVLGHRRIQGRLEHVPSQLIEQHIGADQRQSR